IPVANPPKNAGATKRAGKTGLTKATVRGKPLTKTTRLAKPGLTKATLPGKPGLTKATLPGKTGLTKTTLLAKPGPTTTAPPAKRGVTTTAPPRAKSKAELGAAISAISEIILTAFIAHPANETQP